MRHSSLIAEKLTKGMNKVAWTVIISLLQLRSRYILKHYYLYMHHLEVWSARVSYVSLHPGTPKGSKKRGIPNWAHFRNRFLWIWSKPSSTHHTSTSILRNLTTVHWEEPCYCRHNQVFKEVITSPAELLSKICTALKLLLVMPATNAVSERSLVLFVELRHNYAQQWVRVASTTWLYFMSIENLLIN